jgi:transcriptional regulator with XRE-family HTH domain
MQTTINERLKILVEILGTNQNALAVMLGLSPSTFRNYTDRESKPGYEVLEKLYHSFKHINLYWLFGEPGEPLLPDAAASNSSVSGNRKISRSLFIAHQSGGSATQNQGLATAEQAVTQLEQATMQLELVRAQLAEKERTIQLLSDQLKWQTAQTEAITNLLGHQIEHFKPKGTMPPNP